MSEQHILKQLTVFELTGQDTLAFMNNQIISQIYENDGICYTAICNPKGRILFSMIVLPTENAWQVAVNEDLSDNFFHYVSMRKFRMNISIERSDLKLCHDNNTDSPAQLESLVFNKPQNSNNRLTDEAFWQLMFKLEYPWVTATTSECFIPQHLNLDQKNVIAFDKGCYPGQEIIARLHFIGKVKKRMELITLYNPKDITPGDSMYIDELNEKVEFCSPLIQSHDGWQAQVIKQVK